MLSKIIKEYTKCYPFHMPGHKRNKKLIDTNFLEMDITELTKTDNLHQPTASIADLQKKYANFYGAEEAWILVNGSTAGIVGAMLATLSPGDKILLARNSHKSVFTGLILTGATPIYIYPEITEDGLDGGINLSELEKILMQEQDIKAVLITSPTYMGYCSNIRAIALLTQKYGIKLIVDQAHGAHFGLHESFPKQAITEGADISVISLHKTLPAYGQTAMVLSNSSADKEKISQAISMMQTTSPSYAFMGMLCGLLQLLTSDKGKQLADKQVKLLDNLYNKLRECYSIEIIGKKYLNKYSINSVDISKLVFLVNSKELTGKTLEQKLLSEYGLQLEMSTKNIALAITSIADTKTGFNRLIKGIKEIDRKTTNQLKHKTNYKRLETKQIVSPREAYFAEKKLVSLENSQGLVSSRNIVPYPPGIPILCIGEEITYDKIEEINNYISEKSVIQGMQDLNIWVLAK